MSELTDLFESFTSLPYLFIGSGLSRRYCDADDWESLLRHFVAQINDEPLAYNGLENEAKMRLKNTLNTNSEDFLLPMVATILEEKYNSIWFSDPKFRNNRKKHEDIMIKNKYSPLKLEIAEYIKNKTALTKPEYKRELELLQKLPRRSINGVITTNYDTLIETLFQQYDYDVYVGQEQLLFSSLDGIDDMYKIHGSVEKPNSIVLTYYDYTRFIKQQQYLAAKLMTLFIEHPIIFVGYGMGDFSVNKILESIVNCIGNDNTHKLCERLFFVEWDESMGDERPEVSDVYKTVLQKDIPMKKIKLNNYEYLYSGLLSIKAKYNPRLMKRLQKDIYRLVLTNASSGDLIVAADIDDENLDNAEVVIGVGMKQLAKMGVMGIGAVDIFTDVVLNIYDFEKYPDFLDDLVQKTIPKELGATSNSLPIFKYISHFDFYDLPKKIQTHVQKHTTYESFLSKTILETKKRRKTHESIESTIDMNLGQNKELYEIALIDEEYINLNVFEDYLKDTLRKDINILTDNSSNKSTNIRRLIKLYDWLKHGKDWIKTQNITSV